MMKVAIVQMRVDLSNPQKNIERAERFIVEARKQNANIVCFPEGFLVNLYNPEMLRRYAEKIPGKFVNTFAKLAETHGVYIVMGTIPEKIEGSEQIYNTSVLISSTGDVIGKYRKIGIWHDEKPYTKRGGELPVFKTKIGNLGIQICWDLTFPEITRTLAHKGAEVIFSPSYWKDGDNPLAATYGLPTEERFIDSCCEARAWENQVAFVFVNACGEHVDNNVNDVLTGHSQIILPFYGCIARLGREEGIISKEIDFKAIRDAARVYGVIEDIPQIESVLASKRPNI